MLFLNVNTVQTSRKGNRISDDSHFEVGIVS